MQAQARICPICIDDHSAERECKVSDLKERIARLNIQVEEQRIMLRNAAIDGERLREDMGKDRARLDWVESERPHILSGVDSFWNVMTSQEGFDAETVREAIDAARGGEGE